MKTLSVIIPIIVAIFLFGGLFTTTHAIPYIPLEQGVIKSGGLGTGSPVAGLVNDIVKFILSSITILAVVMLVVGGVQYMTSDVVSSKEAAKRHIGGAIYGLLIAVSIFLILSLVNPQLLNVGLKELGGLKPKLSAPGAQVGPTPGVHPGQLPVPSGSISHDNALATLAASGIDVTSSSGAGGVSATCSGAGCTSLHGIRTAVIVETVSMAESCNCGGFTVTGGTEHGVHAAGPNGHEGGYKIDISFGNSRFNSWIEDPQNSTRIGTRSDGSTLYRYGSNTIVARESDHYDVCVQDTSNNCGAP